MYDFLTIYYVRLSNFTFVPKELHKSKSKYIKVPHISGQT